MVDVHITINHVHVRYSRYVSWYILISPPPSASACLCLCPPTSIDVCLPSTTTPKHTCSVHNYIAPTIRLTSDQGQTHPDLVSMPRAATHMPFSPFVLFD